MKREDFLDLLWDEEEYIFEEITKPIFSENSRKIFEEAPPLIKPVTIAASSLNWEEDLDATRQNMEALWNNPVLKQPLPVFEKEPPISEISEEEHKENIVNLKRVLIDLGSRVAAHGMIYFFLKSGIIFQEVDFFDKKNEEWGMLIPIITLTHCFFKPLSHKILTKMFDSEEEGAPLRKELKIKDLLCKIKSENKMDPLKTQEEMVKESLSNGKEISAGENNLSWALENIKEII